MAFRTTIRALLPYSLDPTGQGPAAPEPEQPESDDYLALIAPSNNSGVFGAAAVHIDEAAGSLTVRLVAEGLTPEHQRRPFTASQLHPRWRP